MLTVRNPPTSKLLISLDVGSLRHQVAFPNTERQVSDGGAERCQVCVQDTCGRQVRAMAPAVPWHWSELHPGAGWHGRRSSRPTQTKQDATMFERSTVAGALAG